MTIPMTEETPLKQGSRPYQEIDVDDVECHDDTTLEEVKDTRKFRLTKARFLVLSLVLISAMVMLSVFKAWFKHFKKTVRNGQNVT